MQKKLGWKNALQTAKSARYAESSLAKRSFSNKNKNKNKTYIALRPLLHKANWLRFSCVILFVTMFHSFNRKFPKMFSNVRRWKIPPMFESCNFQISDKYPLYATPTTRSFLFIAHKPHRMHTVWIACNKLLWCWEFFLMQFYSILFLCLHTCKLCCGCASISQTNCEIKEKR